jgi:hypothetical protein
MPLHYRMLLGSQFMFLLFVFNMRYKYRHRQDLFDRRRQELLEQELLENPFVANDLRQVHPQGKPNQPS